MICIHKAPALCLRGGGGGCAILIVLVLKTTALSVYSSDTCEACYINTHVGILLMLSCLDTCRGSTCTMKILQDIN